MNLCIELHRSDSVRRESEFGTIDSISLQVYQKVNLGSDV